MYNTPVAQIWGKFYRYFFICPIRERMIIVICTIIDYWTKDRSGRPEWSIFNSWCSLYFFPCISSNLCRKKRKVDCLVKVMLPNLGSSAFSSSILAIILCVNDLFSHSCQSRYIFCSCRLTSSSDKHHKNLSCLSSSKNRWIFIHLSIRQPIFTALRADWSV